MRRPRPRRRLSGHSPGCRCKTRPVSMAKRISKTQYLMGLQCPKRLWLYNHRRDLVPPPDAALQGLFDEGHAVDELSRLALPGGELVAFDNRRLHLALKRTAALVKEGPRFIYEGAFAAGIALVRCDILERNYDGTWDLVEAKSAAGVHEEHLADAAVQRCVLEDSGLKINKAWLLFLDGSYVRRGPLDPEKLLKREDITVRTAELLPEVRDNLAKFMCLIVSGDMPEVSIGRHCSAPYDCEFRGHCWKGLPDYSIYDIPRLAWEKKNLLHLQGVLKFTDVPDNFELNEVQRLYQRVERTGQAVINRPAIRTFLNTLEYPLYYLDFETLMPGIPLYDGSRPYQQLPFQASLHIQAAPGAEPSHIEYLGDSFQDPRPGLIKVLCGNIGSKGSLVAYNAGFEAARLKELAEDFPASRSALLGFADRLVDLMLPFQQQLYVDPLFKGRYSIKVVLPALVPELTYEGLAIANGGAAQRAYSNLVHNRLNPDEREKARRDLKAYCGQDTLAMVKIMAKLYAVAAGL